MAVITKDELIAKINAFIGDRSDDDALSVLDDLTDTLAGLEAAAKTDWQTKYNELDASWRERYRRRFTAAEPGEGTVETETLAPVEPEVPEKRSFEELFETK